MCDCTGTNHTGQFCQLPACNPACVHGSCAAVDYCDCGSTGYNGTLCDIPICSPPCINGGICSSPGTCGCPGSYRGPQCETPYCFPQCLNGGFCGEPYTCYCNGTGYFGGFCEAPLPPTDYTAPNNTDTDQYETLIDTTDEYTIPDTSPPPDYGTTNNPKSAMSAQPDPIDAIFGVKSGVLTPATIGLIAGGAALVCCCCIGGVLWGKISGDKAVKRQNSRRQLINMPTLSEAAFDVNLQKLQNPEQTDLESNGDSSGNEKETS